MNKKYSFPCLLLAACLGLFMASPTKAASLQLVASDWGTNGVPTNVIMYVYVPDKVVTNPPILVLLHYWGGGAGGVFAEAQGGDIVAAADAYGFIMVVPQTPDCWDANSAQSLTHNGGGQTEAIAHMVNYTVSHYHANADRVYVTGTSCGAMMTEALLAAYPDIFKAGAAFAGQAVGGAWTPVTHTAQQWGDIVRAAYPGYSGRRPRVQLWHGTADGIINYSNQVEAIMQWGNVLGLAVNPTTTATGVKIGNITNDWTHQAWKDSCGNTLLDAWSEIGGPHGTDANLNAQYVIPFLGLDHVGPTDPVAPCDRPGGLVAMATNSNRVKISWNAFTNATGYNVKRSTVSGGPYPPIATGVASTNYTDAVASVRDGYYYVVSAMVGGGETPDSPEVAVSFPKLAGGIIGTAGSYNNGGNTITNVFDDNVSTFFDGPNISNGNGCWVGLDFGAGVSNVITQINYCPRSGFEGRMVGGVFQGANQSNFSDAVTLFTIGTQPASGTFTSVDIANATAFRFVRYLSPNGGWGNVGELQFYGYLSAVSAQAPTGLSATAVSASQVNLVWNALASGAAYIVKRSTTNGGSFSTVASGLATTSYQDSNLAGGTIYYYAVSAVISGNETPNSATATATTASPTAGSLVHRYSFSETGGTTVADSVGGPVWTGTLPNGGALAGGRLTLSSGSQQYASLPAGIVGSLSNFTILAWVNLNSSSNWSRIFDFGGDATNYLFLTPQNGITGNLRFAITTNGGGNEQQINCSSTLSTGAWHQVAVTLNAQTGVLYLDGVAAGTNNSMTLNPLSLGRAANNYLGKSQYPDPYFDGSLEEFRIYNVGLSAGEIAATAVLGPGQSLSTNSPPVGLATVGTSLTLSWPLASAGFTLQSTTNLASGDWTTAMSVAPQIVSNQWQMTLSQTSNNATFYRLVK